MSANTGPPPSDRLFDVAATAETEDTLTVVELHDQAGMALRAAFPRQVWVRGELSSLRRPNSGIVYFDLTEPTDGGGTRRIPVVLFTDKKALVNRRLKEAGGAIRMSDGLEVRIRGRVELYSRHSTVQLQMTDIDPAYTLGKMAVARDVLLGQLAESGLIDANGALPLPTAPLTVGLVTSPGSAAEADFLDELRSSGLSWRVLRHGATVQGAGAEHSIAEAIAMVGRSSAEIIALVRGGGARTDLAAFDQPAVAHAIAASPIPVVTGIGHEIDDSVADRVAHSSFKTPTACAGAIIAMARGGLDLAEASFGGIAAAVDRHLDTATATFADTADRFDQLATQSLDGAQRRLIELSIALGSAATEASHVATLDLHEAQNRLYERAHRPLEGASQELTRAQRTLALVPGAHLDRGEVLVNHAGDRLRLLDPQHLLGRGWSITRTADGEILRSIKTVSDGTKLVTQLHDGTVSSTVTSSTVTSSTVTSSTVDSSSDAATESPEATADG